MLALTYFEITENKNYPHEVWRGDFGGVVSHFFRFCGGQVVMPSLPEAVRSLAEVEANVVFSTWAAVDNK